MSQINLDKPPARRLDAEAKKAINEIMQQDEFQNKRTVIAWRDKKKKEGSSVRF